MNNEVILQDMATKGRRQLRVKRKVCNIPSVHEVIYGRKFSRYSEYLFLPTSKMLKEKLHINDKLALRWANEPVIRTSYF